MELSLSEREQMREWVSRIALVPRRAARVLFSVYRSALSALLAWDCRHLPTCSEYAEEAIGRFGLWAGGWMALARLCRCHPLGTRGLDFVPANLPERARWFLPWRYGRWRGTYAGPSATPELHAGFD